MSSVAGLGNTDRLSENRGTNNWTVLKKTTTKTQRTRRDTLRHAQRNKNTLPRRLSKGVSSKFPEGYPIWEKPEGRRAQLDINKDEDINLNVDLNNLSCTSFKNRI